jgi:hypothetical protein
MSSHRPAGAVHRRCWTAAQVRALGVRTDIATFASIMGMSESSAREAYHAGRLPVPVLRVGRRLVVPVAPILAALGLGDGGQQIRSAGRDQAPSERGEQPGDSKVAGTPTPAT